MGRLEWGWIYFGEFVLFVLFYNVFEGSVERDKGKVLRVLEFIVFLSLGLYY